MIAEYRVKSKPWALPVMPPNKKKSLVTDIFQNQMLVLLHLLNSKLFKLHSLFEELSFEIFIWKWLNIFRFMVISRGSLLIIFGKTFYFSICNILVFVIYMNAYECLNNSHSYLPSTFGGIYNYLFLPWILQFSY